MSEQVSCRVLENTQVQVVARNHSWLCDQPSSSGGDDLGPTPLEWLLAAVGASAVLEVGGRAATEGVAVERVAADLEGEWHGEGDDRRYRISCSIQVRGDLGGEAVDRLRKWAAGCAVGRIVSPGAEVDFDVVKV